MNKVVTRIAPSPTGTFHIGTARSALFNYIFAKQNDGKFIVRFEDTDKKRSEEKYKKEILKSLDLLGIKPDEIHTQTKRKNIYKKYIKKLLDMDMAYVSLEPAKSDSSKEVSVIRFRNKENKVSFEDSVRGDISIDISELGDFVIARSLDDPLYNLAVVIDDIEMDITHVIRGDDHIVNTPRQVVLFNAFGEIPPKFIHMPLIHSIDGKLSKRKNSTSVINFIKEGYLIEALINYIALIGWHPKNNRELFTLKELIKEFQIKDIQKEKGVFDEKKLAWFNKIYMKDVSDCRIKKEISKSIVKRFGFKSYFSPNPIKSIIHLIREQGLTFKEQNELIEKGEYDYFYKMPKFNEVILLKNQKGKGVVLKNLKESCYLLGLVKNWKEEDIYNSIIKHADKNGKNDVLWPLRVSLTGKEKSPSPFLVAESLGKTKTLKYVKNTISSLK